MNIKEFSHNLQKLYQEMSETFSSYQSSTGWNCMSGCGRCCLKPDIEASPFEMIPMALQIFEEGQLDHWLDKLQENTQGPCPIFQAQDGDGKGKCGRYQDRPSVCRMFAVGGHINKSGETTLSICKFLREEYHLANPTPAPGPEVPPIIVQWSYRLSSFDQRLIQDRVPIREALLTALQKVAFSAQLQSYQNENY